MFIFNNKYFRAILAVIIYFFVMEFLGTYIALFIKDIYNYNEILFINDAYLNPFSYLKIPFTEILNFMSLLLQTSMYLLLFTSLIITLYKDLVKDEYDYKNRTESLQKQFLPSILLYFIVTMVTNAICVLLSTSFNVSLESLNQTNIETLVSSSSFNKLVMACSVCFMGPIVEELIFRKSMFTICKNKYVGLVISSIIFGLMHTLSFGYEPLRLLVVSLPYISSGFVFGIIYIRSDNIFMPILIHALLNTMSLLLI